MHRLTRNANTADEQRGLSRAVVRGVVFLAVVCAMVAPAIAQAMLPPHVATGADTDACAICHRSHSAASNVNVETTSTTKPNALILGQDCDESA